ncbi:unnamed protein product [Closterium sp. Naga37s-1]|nr:unnamed protein product [Closterium sp. Naga37s-1]
MLVSASMAYATAQVQADILAGIPGKRERRIDGEFVTREREELGFAAYSPASSLSSSARPSPFPRNAIPSLDLGPLPSKADARNPPPKDVRGRAGASAEEPKLTGRAGVGKGTLGEAAAGAAVKSTEIRKEKFLGEGESFPKTLRTGSYFDCEDEVVMLQHKITPSMVEESNGKAVQRKEIEDQRLRLVLADEEESDAEGPVSGRKEGELTAEDVAEDTAEVTISERDAETDTETKETRLRRFLDDSVDCVDCTEPADCADGSRMGDSSAPGTVSAAVAADAPTKPRTRKNARKARVKKAGKKSAGKKQRNSVAEIERRAQHADEAAAEAHADVASEPTATRGLSGLLASPLVSAAESAPAERICADAESSAEQDHEQGFAIGKETGGHDAERVAARSGVAEGSAMAENSAVTESSAGAGNEAQRLNGQGAGTADNAETKAGTTHERSRLIEEADSESCGDDVEEELRACLAGMAAEEEADIRRELEDALMLGSSDGEAGEAEVEENCGGEGRGEDGMREGEREGEIEPLERGSTLDVGGETEGEGSECDDKEGFLELEIDLIALQEEEEKEEEAEEAEVAEEAEEAEGEEKGDEEEDDEDDEEEDGTAGIVEDEAEEGKVKQGEDTVLIVGAEMEAEGGAEAEASGNAAEAEAPPPQQEQQEQQQEQQKKQEEQQRSYALCVAESFEVDAILGNKKAGNAETKEEEAGNEKQDGASHSPRYKGADCAVDAPLAEGGSGAHLAEEEDAEWIALLEESLAECARERQREAAERELAELEAAEREAAEVAGGGGVNPFGIATGECEVEGEAEGEAEGKAESEAEEIEMISPRGSPPSGGIALAAPPCEGVTVGEEESVDGSDVEEDESDVEEDESDIEEDESDVEESDAEEDESEVERQSDVEQSDVEEIEMISNPRSVGGSERRSEKARGELADETNGGDGVDETDEVDEVEMKGRGEEQEEDEEEEEREGEGGEKELEEEGGGKAVVPSPFSSPLPSPHHSDASCQSSGPKHSVKSIQSTGSRRSANSRTSRASQESSKSTGSNKYEISQKSILSTDSKTSNRAAAAQPSTTSAAQLEPTSTTAAAQPFLLFTTMTSPAAATADRNTFSLPAAADVAVFRFGKAGNQGRERSEGRERRRVGGRMVAARVVGRRDIGEGAAGVGGQKTLKSSNGKGGGGEKRRVRKRQRVRGEDSDGSESEGSECGRVQSGGVASTATPATTAAAVSATSAATTASIPPSLSRAITTHSALSAHSALPPPSPSTSFPSPALSAHHLLSAFPPPSPDAALRFLCSPSFPPPSPGWPLRKIRVVGRNRRPVYSPVHRLSRGGAGGARGGGEAGGNRPLGRLEEGEGNEGEEGGKRGGRGQVGEGGRKRSVKARWSRVVSVPASMFTRNEFDMRRTRSDRPGATTTGRPLTAAATTISQQEERADEAGENGSSKRKPQSLLKSIRKIRRESTPRPEPPVDVVLPHPPMLHTRSFKHQAPDNLLGLLSLPNLVPS